VAQECRSIVRFHFVAHLSCAVAGRFSFYDNFFASDDTDGAAALTQLMSRLDPTWKLGTAGFGLPSRCSEGVEA
jgi:hypothetical protein